MRDSVSSRLAAVIQCLISRVTGPVVRPRFHFLWYLSCFVFKQGVQRSLVLLPCDLSRVLPNRGNDCEWNRQRLSVGVAGLRGRRILLYSANLWRRKREIGS